MTITRYLCATFGLALLLVAGTAYGESTVTVDGTTETTPAPLVAITVYDGTTLPATVIAGCSEPTWCTGTGTVTHVKNYIGWQVAGGDPKGRIYLFVDGEYAASARPGRLLLWNTSNLAAGPHTLEAMARNMAGVEGWSKPLTITLVK